MKSFFKNIASALLYLLPSEMRYEICRHHANKEFAENRSDFRSNGELWLMEKIIPGVSTVFDVGAHRGEWASEALRINKDIELHCFEPCSRSYSELEKGEFGEKIFLNNFGLGSQQCEKTMYIFDGSGEGNSLFIRSGLELRKDYSPQDRSETVRIETLDDYCTDKGIGNIDFLKIDVEGNELAVIEGAKGLFGHEAIGVAVFEYGGAYIDSRILLKDFFQFFSETDYDIFLLYPDKVAPIPIYDCRLENFQYKNFLIVNRAITEKIGIFS